jgi:pimeloyl-ACP methyl ester carboxylesterase
MLFVEREGDESLPALVLLHGLGGNGAVWDGVRRILAGRYRFVVPDFAGHGYSPRATNYSLGRHAADVAALLKPGTRVRILGHSMGGAVGLILATGWFGIAVEKVVALGMKLNWTAEEMAKMGQPFPVRWFETREEAATRFLRVGGLADALTPDARTVERGIVSEAGRWRLAADPETVRVVGPESAALIAGARQMDTPVRFACGTRDPLVGLEEMRHYDPAAVTVEGGHNAHVENPTAVADLVA